MHTIKNTPGNQPLIIRTDSRFAMDGLTKYAQDWEAKDWMGVAHGQLFKCATAWLRARTAHTTLEWVKGHAGIKGNEEADKLAAIGAQQAADENGMDLRIPADTMATGAMLAKIGQSAIYRHLTDTGCIGRKATRRNVEKVKITTKEIFEETPTEKAIWESIRHKDVSKNS